MNQIERKKAEKTQNSLAAELMQRLGNRDATPILLPPQDYDTVHRSKGNLVGIQIRKYLSEDTAGGKEVDEKEGDQASGAHPEFHEDDILPVQPRWKKGGQFVEPPRDARRAPSPEATEDRGRPARRDQTETSPREETDNVDDNVFPEDGLRHAMPRWKNKEKFVPPPMLRRATEPYMPGPRSPSPEPREGRPLPNPPRSGGYGRNIGDYPEPGKKYTATKLGLSSGGRGGVRRNASFEGPFGQGSDYQETRNPIERPAVTRRHSQHTRKAESYSEFEEWKERGGGARRSQDYQP